MKILSFDVGIKNLAYCLIEKITDDDTNSDFKIHKWGIINLADDQKKCDFIIRGGNQCQQSAKTLIYHKDSVDLFNNESKTQMCVCALHKKKVMPQIIELVVKRESDVPTCINCDCSASYVLSTNTQLCWCDIHRKKYGDLLIKKISAKRITVVNCNKQPIQSLAETLFEKLDSEPMFLTVSEILIENQPTLKNPTMKTISSLLYSYFVMRGITDKLSTDSNIDIVRFVSPSNKLKIDKKTTDDTLENVDKNKTYKLVKKLGIKYCTALIDKHALKILDTYKKKDDMCDAFLQGMQYLYNPLPAKYFLKLQTLGFEEIIQKPKVVKKFNVIDDSD